MDLLFTVALWDHARMDWRKMARTLIDAGSIFLRWICNGRYSECQKQLERQETQECYWELEKFLRLALRANPNVLECLYTPLVEEKSQLAEELLVMRDCFLTKQVYQTYNGYVMSQFKKLGQDLRNKGAIRWKHAMHLVRLLLSGITILLEGIVPVQVGRHRDQLLAMPRPFDRNTFNAHRQSGSEPKGFERWV
jgi:predicted nucleotidyltransferase